MTATDAAGCTATLTYTFAAANLFFLDDRGRSKFCANVKTGDYIWVILTGPGAGTYTGTANVLNRGAKIVRRTGAANTLNVSHDALRKKATGHFIAGGNYNPLGDSNTANNVGCCSCKPHRGVRRSGSSRGAGLRPRASFCRLWGISPFPDHPATRPRAIR